MSRLNRILLVALLAAGICASSSSQQATINGVPAFVGNTYSGLVSTRNEMMETTSGSNTWSMGRTTEYARVPIAANSMKIVFGNFYVPTTNIETSPAAASTYKVSVEYPSGTFTACTYGGASTGSITGIGHIVTDACGPAIPSGARFWIRAQFQNSAGIIYSQSSSNHYNWTSNPLTGDAFIFGTGTAADYTASTAVNAGTPVFSAATNTLMAPIAVLGPTNQPTVVFIGDSRCVGNGDSLNDQSGDVGELSRAVGASFGYSKLCAQGTKAVDFLTGSNATERQALIALMHPSVVIDALGVNDIFAGTAVATVVSSRNSIAALWPTIPTWGTTIPPETTTTIFTLTAAGTASGGSTIYTGTLANCGSNACIGSLYTIAGFTTGANNGAFVASASSTTTLTVANAAGVAETHAGTATDNYSSTFNQASVGAGNTTHLYQFNQQQALRGTVPNEVREIDVNQVVDPNYTGLWAISAQPGTTAYSLTQNWGTTDGVHEAWPMNNFIANRLAFSIAEALRATN